MPKIIAIVFLLLLFSFYFLINIFKVTVRANGITATLPQAIFYIPSLIPIKVYSFKSDPVELKEIIKKYQSQYPGTLGIYIKNLHTNQEITLNQRERFAAASLYKLGVMYSVFKKGNEGKLDLNNPNIKSNLDAMITYSSNEAAYYLVENYVSWNIVTKDLQEIGLSNTSLNQNPPYTTPEDMGKLLSIIADGKAVNLEASTLMLELMSGQKRNDRIPVLLPEDIIIAHKTGELEDVRHDAGVVVGKNNDIIFVLMSKGGSNPESVKPIMSNLTKEIYDFFETQWQNPPEIL